MLKTPQSETTALRPTARLVRLRASALRISFGRRHSDFGFPACAALPLRLDRGEGRGEVSRTTLKEATALYLEECPEPMRSRPRPPAFV